MWKTGHSLIKAKMQETHAELAGEMSGHMFFADRYYGFDDALYAACRLMEIVAQIRAAAVCATGGSAQDGRHAGDPRRLPRRAANSRWCARSARNSADAHQTVDVDGVRILFPHGWGLVRASNTQPVLVMRFEASTPELLAEYRKEVETAVELAAA